MVKNKTRKKNLATQRKRRQRIPRVPRSPQVSTAMVHQVCGLTDPFCKHAAGAKYPDDSNTRTLTIPFEMLYNMGTDANGNGCGVVFPQYRYEPYAAAASMASASSCTIGTFFGSAPLANATQFRIVSVGIVIDNITAPLYSSGMVHIRTFGYDDGIPFSAPFNPQTMAATEIRDIPLQQTKHIQVVVPHTSQPPQSFYESNLVSPSSSVADWTAPGFAPVSISISGGPVSVTALVVKVIVNYEVVIDFRAQPSLARLATPAPRSNPVVTAAAAAITSSSNNIFQAGVAAVGKFFERKALGVIGGMLGGPTGYALGNAASMTIMDVD